MDEIANIYANDSNLSLMDAISGLTGKPIADVNRECGYMSKRGVFTVEDFQRLDKTTAAEVYRMAKPNFMLIGALRMIYGCDFLKEA